MIPDGCVQECPGCKYRSFSSTESDNQKTNWVRTFFPQAQAIISPEYRWQYRKKTVLHAKWDSIHGWQFGLIKKRLSKFSKKPIEDFIPIHNCPVHSLSIKTTLNKLQSILPDILPLSYLAISGSALTLVLKTKKNLNLLRGWSEGITIEGIKSFFVNWNPGAGNRIFHAKEWTLIYGSELVDNPLHGPSSFSQQIPQMEYSVIQSASDFFSTKNIVDFYSGIGVSLIEWGRRNLDCVGVELNGEALRAAKINAPKAKLLRGRVEERLPQVKEFLSKIDGDFSLYSNPPRAGHTLEVNKFIQEVEPKEIAYLSCNVKTLKQDLQNLENKFYIEKIQPYDFFPQTDHVEVLAFLKRRP